jgi:hypothetical protein
MHILILHTIIENHFLDVECGQLRIIPDDLRTQVPWVATVFIQKSQNASHHFVLIGTVVGPRSVLTVLKGTFGSSMHNFPPENIFVVGGPISTLPATLDSHSALRQVKHNSD